MTKNLRLIVLTEEQHARTCNYWYLVRSDYIHAHTAFETKHGLMRWLTERNLSLTEPLTEPGTHSVQSINGEYVSNSMMSKKAFDKLSPVFYTRTLSNGDYTLAAITEDDGIRTVNYLNPNVHERRIFDYKETNSVMR